MRIISLITFCTLCALFTAGQNSQDDIRSLYKFSDDKDVIIPEIDYSRIYIVFTDSMDEDDMINFNKAYPMLKENMYAKCLHEHHKHYILDKKFSSDQLNSELLLESIRKEPTVLSACPALIRDQHTAFADNLILLNTKKAKKSDKELVKLIRSRDCHIVEKHDFIQSITYVLINNSGISNFQICMDLSAYDGINYAQPNLHFSAKSNYVTNDTHLAEQWYLDQPNDADIDAKEAWDISKGKLAYNPLFIGILDGHGIDSQHEDLYYNFGGYNAADDNYLIVVEDEEENHGTAVTGIVGAYTNNEIGISSVGFSSAAYLVKIGYNYGPGGSFNTSDLILIRACEHIISISLQIVAIANTYSLGAWANTEAVRNAFKDMREMSRDGDGSVILASMGNDSTSNVQSYPALFPHVIGVGATDQADQRCAFSNYGDSLDLVAPGNEIYTLDRTGPDGYTTSNYCNISGTSAACPVAAATIALIASKYPYESWEFYQKILCGTCDKIEDYSFSYDFGYSYSTRNAEVGYGRVNAFRAVQASQGLFPPNEFELTVTTNDVSLSWSDPWFGEEMEEIYYDGNVAHQMISDDEYVLATHFSPEGPCTILTIKYYTEVGYYIHNFNAKIYGWGGDEPETDARYSESFEVVHQDWLGIDVSDKNLIMDGDFAVGFGCVNDGALLGYDTLSEDGRAWRQGGLLDKWTQQQGTYMIRAIVMYPDGNVEELGDIKGYRVYRDNVPLNDEPFSSTEYLDENLNGGTYEYTVTAWYYEGESSPVGPKVAEIEELNLDLPVGLNHAVNGSTVYLNWSSPTAGTEELIRLHDNSFEDSFSSTNGGAGLGQVFSMTSAPATLKKIRFFTVGYQLWGKPMSIYVLDQTGYNVLGGPYLVNGLENAWITINTNVFLEYSSFMIATYNNEPQGPYVGVDDSYYNGSLYFGNHIMGFTELSVLGDYHFVGSHEALVQYAEKSSRKKSEWILPSSAADDHKNILDKHHEKIPLSAPYPAPSKSLLGYNIFRDGDKIGENTTSSTSFTDDNVPDGDYKYGVSAFYEEGESNMAGPIDVHVFYQGNPPPTNLSGSLNGNIASLSWIPPGGNNEELEYDNDNATGAYNWPGYTMAVHMSPAGPCQVLQLKYLTGINNGGSNFHAQIFDWGNNQPGSLLWFKNNVSAQNGWVELDISTENFMVDGDFVLGYHSLDTLSFLAYDASLNNERSWDYNEITGLWSLWEETYMIRAVVQYSNGKVEEINGVLGYNIYRNNIKVNTQMVTSTYASNEIPAWGEYIYNVTAVYAESQSVFSNDYFANYYFGIDEGNDFETSIFPNPASGEVHISSEVNMESLSLFSMDGVKLISIESPGTEHHLKIDQLQSGIYILKLEQKERYSMFKIVVNN